MIQVPELTYDYCDRLSKTAMTQWRTSKSYKQPRMRDIQESENMYAGMVAKSMVRENNDPFPFMSGFVDHLYAELDDAPDIEFSHQDEADYKYAKKVSSFFNSEKDSALPHNKWALKDRYVKKFAIFSGRGIFKYFAESEPVYRSVLQAVDHYDFHCEPAGGGHLEDHLFCGQEAIFKTKDELLNGAKDEYYDLTQVLKLTTMAQGNVYKSNEDDYQNRLNRYRSLGLDPQSNNYVGTELFKFCEWYLTVDGVRWYILFEERTGTWVRCKALRDIFSPIESTGDALYPFVSWATHEDGKVFWSKAPCDDARAIAKRIDKLINQEIYNREKKNKGTRLYDPNMIEDIEALADERPDGLIPVNTRGGKRNLNQAIYSVQHGEITGTLDLVQFLDSYYGQKSGSTPGSMGSAEKDKKVGIYYGELQQVQKRLTIYNISYREAWQELGIRFMIGLDDHLRGEEAIQLLGPNGIEWGTLTRADLKRTRPIKIKVKGGAEEAQKNEILAKKKVEALGQTTTVNPRWKDRELLKAAGYTDEQLKDAFASLDGTNDELMSEAAQAITDIENGKKPRKNRGANAAFMQKILDYSYNMNVEDNEKELKIAQDLVDYALEHVEIAAQNETRSVVELMKARSGVALGGANETGGAVSAVQNSMVNSMAPKTAPNPMAAPSSMAPNYQGRPAEVGGMLG